MPSLPATPKWPRDRALSRQAHALPGPERPVPGNAGSGVRQEEFEQREEGAEGEDRPQPGPRPPRPDRESRRASQPAGRVAPSLSSTGQPVPPPTARAGAGAAGLAPSVPVPTRPTARSCGPLKQDAARDAPPLPPRPAANDTRHGATALAEPERLTVAHGLERGPRGAAVGLPSRPRQGAPARCLRDLPTCLWFCRNHTHKCTPCRRGGASHPQANAQPLGPGGDAEWS